MNTVFRLWQNNNLFLRKQNNVIIHCVCVTKHVFGRIRLGFSSIEKLNPRVGRGFDWIPKTESKQKVKIESPESWVSEQKVKIESQEWIINVGLYCCKKLKFPKIQKFQIFSQIFFWNFQFSRYFSLLFPLWKVMKNI